MLLRSDVRSDFLILRLKAGETPKMSAHAHIFIDFNAYKRNLAKWFCTFMENVWLHEPTLEAFENIDACRNEVSHTREGILLAILRIQEYTRSCGCCLAADIHKYAKETTCMNNCNMNTVHPPP